MFGLLTWWRNLRARRRRNLFEFFDGRRFVKRDPWPIYRQLYNDETFVIGKDKDDPADMLVPALNLDEPEFSKCVACGHRALGTKPYDPATGAGLTETEVVATVEEFLAWCDDLLKKNGGLLTSSAPTGSTSSIGPECQAGPMSSPLPSNCSPTESTPAAAS
jgi:hypothetical protein